MTSWSRCGRLRGCDEHNAVSRAVAWAPWGSSLDGEGWALLPKWDPCSGAFIWTVGDWTRGSSFLLNLHPVPSAKLRFYRSCHNIECYPRATGFQFSVCPLSFYFRALLQRGDLTGWPVFLLLTNSTRCLTKILLQSRYPASAMPKGI